ncbi:methyl-accepting chemotaxis protein [Paenibacillus sp. F411]|uniref:methyl-accepting chemotaxis protein n=1 Tax=Paenibacillus sp. F411 TaxID=2820239 RepID=UPI001AAF0E6F|nr:methyl-accepting chemotaxis protein [Paenibacillus sp. F411]MBO2942851.1 methyl-accepting chemotaxis protein [Paenibacillus sp. F411]
MEKDVEQQLLDKGSALAKSLAQTLQSLTEDDLRNGVTLSNGQAYTGQELRTRLFNDQLSVLPESEEAARKRMENEPDAMNKLQLLHDGSEIPLWQYELKYSSEYDAYTDDKWQSVIDSFLVDSSVVFAIPAAYSDNPEAAGYIATHNTTYSPTGELSLDPWGDTGLLSQKYRANRVFNDKTGYAAAANTDTSQVLLQKYPRVIDGRVVETWDISYPLYIDGEHWGGVRVALSKDASDLMAAKQKQSVLLQFSVLFVMVLVLIYILNRYIIGKKLQQLLFAAQNLNSGQADLTYRIRVKGQDELAGLANEINRFIHHLEQLMTRVKQSTQQLNASSLQLHQSALETSEVTESLSKSLNDTVKGTQNQSQALRESARAMEELAESVTKVAEAAGTVNQAALFMNQGAKQGGRSLKAAVGQMNEVNQAAQLAQEAILKLNEHSAHIGEMASVVQGVASQTQMLALNASIEAARAGEHGRGFAVVASEIRKLSEQSRTSAEQITALITDIQDSVEQTASSIQSNSHEIEVGVNMMQKTSLIFEELIESAGAVSSQISEISQAAEQMSAGTEEISAALEEVSQIALKSSESGKDMKQEAAKQSAAVEQTMQQADHVKRIAEELDDSSSQFVLDRNA